MRNSRASPSLVARVPRRWTTGALGVALGTSLFIVTLSCGDGDGGTGPPPPGPPPPGPPRATTVTVRPATARLTALSDSVRFTAEVSDQYSNALTGAAVSWSTSDAAVAMVNASGVATAASAGTATITATSGSASGSAAVTVVQEVSAVIVTPAEAALAPGDTVTLDAQAEDANGSPIDDAVFAWSSSDTAVATVDTTGLVHAVDEGSATITATSGNESGSAAVTVVREVAVVSVVVVTPAEARLAPGDTVTFTARAEDANGSPIDDAVFAWSSSDTAVATVDTTGLVHAVDAGNATITATSGMASGHAQVTVVATSQRMALEAFYRSTGGEEWINQGNWLTDAPLGQWYGVTAREGRVVSLLMMANNLNGPIPPQIEHLTSLRTVRLGDNLLSGEIPPELGNLSSLHSLNLSVNALSGPIPPELGRLDRLGFLHLSINNLSGEIPTELGGLTSLQVLSLPYNDLEGELPTELGNLEAVWSMDLRGNLLRGAIPQSFLRLGLQHFEFTGPGRNLTLCLPGTPDFVAWATRASVSRPSYCNESDLSALKSLYEATGGTDWTNSDGWPAGGPAPAGWYGVRSDTLGRVVALDLQNNGLSGELPAQLGHLSAMIELRIGGNALTGRLPLSLATVPLRELRYADTELCTPADAAFRAWLTTIAMHEGSGVECDALADRDILTILYRATGGPNWHTRNNWLTDAPLRDWYGVGVDSQGRVVTLDLFPNNLVGIIPSELGQLTELQNLVLARNRLTGPIPAALGSLRKLVQLWLYDNRLNGPIPPELGNMSALVQLSISGNPLTGTIPPTLGNLANLDEFTMEETLVTGPIPRELGNLSRLKFLNLDDNALTGSIPPELGNLFRLTILGLRNNRLTGPLAPELGNLVALRDLSLANNDLSGAIPTTFGGLASLEELNLSNNSSMSGAVPASLQSLDRLTLFMAGGTELCMPDDPALLQWLETVTTRRVLRCPTGERSSAYLTQAVQSLEFPVSLVADEAALLRVFVTAAQETNAAVPPVKARFYHGSSEVHVIDIGAGTEPIPIEVKEGALEKSANAEVPGWVVQPGLQMVIEIDPDNTLDPGLGVQKRIPATGRKAVDVKEMSTMQLTVIPFLWNAQPDSSLLAITNGLTAGDTLLWKTRTFLPIRELDVDVHDPVWTDTEDTFENFHKVEAIRVMEGGTGYYMGTLKSPSGGSAGAANTPGFSSFVATNGRTMAHELGHNMSLYHAPCGGPAQPDRSFPSINGATGAWGYDFRAGGSLVSPSYKDLMSYCRPEWISEYSFSNALIYRLEQHSTAARARSAESLLLWGGLDEKGDPFLEPAFVVDAPPVLPRMGGAYRLTGLTDGGEELFVMDFDMLEVSDGGAPSFAFALPARPEWAGRLATITLSGPAGSVSMGRESERSMTILRDPGTGQVRGILRGGGREAGAGDASRVGRGLEVLLSSGTPDKAQWRR